MFNLLRKILPIQYDYNPRNLHPMVQQVVYYLQQQDFSTVEAIYKNFDPYEISLVTEGVSELIEQDDLLDPWFDGSNGPVLSCLLRGTIMLKRAWFYRGWGRGHMVSEERWKRMYEALHVAYNSLIPIVEDRTYGSEACARLIKVFKGLSVKWDQIDEILKIMHGYDHVNMIGEVYYLIASCEKWLGSHDKMFRFALDRATQNPDKPELGALVAAAHFERHMYWERFDENQIEADKYKTNFVVIDEIIEFRDKLLNQYKGNSLEHILAHNIFAGVSCEFGLFPVATPSFMIMEKRVSPYPWDFIGTDNLQDSYNQSMAFKKQYMKKGGYFDTTL